MVLPFWPSTNWPPMNKPVLKDVSPLCTSVSHLCENMAGMVGIKLKWVMCGGDRWPFYRSQCVKVCRILSQIQLRIDRSMSVNIAFFGSSHLLPLFIFSRHPPFNILLLSLIHLALYGSYCFRRSLISFLQIERHNGWSNRRSPNGSSLGKRLGHHVKYFHGN